MNESPSASTASEPLLPERHASFRLTSSRWIGGRRELSRAGFALYFLVLLIHPLLMCDCGAVPGLIMALSSLLPLFLGSRGQRIVAVLCLGFALSLAYTGFQRMSVTHERGRHLQTLPSEWKNR